MHGTEPTGGRGQQGGAGGVAQGHGRGWRGPSARRAAHLPAGTPIEAEVSTVSGAGRYERSDSSFASWSEPRRLSEQALVAAVAEAYAQGVSMRKVEALVHPLGITGLSKSEASRKARSLDEQGQVFRERWLDAVYPSLWLNARYEHVREGGRVLSVAVVAYGVRADGVREVVGVDLRLSEDVVLWRAFLQGLVGPGLTGAPGDQRCPDGLEASRARSPGRRELAALARALPAQGAGAGAEDGDGEGQRHRAHDVRTGRPQARPDADRPRLRGAAGALPGGGKAAGYAEEMILTFYNLPQPHWRQSPAPPPLERLNKELKRLGEVVGSFPNRAAGLRRFSALLTEQTDEWLVGRHSLSEVSMRPLLEAAAPALPATNTEVTASPPHAPAMKYTT